MGEIIKKLKSLGLTEGEAKVYLSLTRGNSTKSNIVKDSGVSSSIVYDILEKLITKGLAFLTIIEGKKYYQAAPPEKLMDLVELKKEELRKMKKSVDELVLLLKRKKENLFFVNIYKGMDGLKTLLKEVEREFQIDNSKEWLAFGITSYKRKSFNIFWSKWHRFIRPKYNVKAKLILCEKGTDYFKKLNEAPLAEIRVFLSNPLCCVSIYGDLTIIMKYSDPSNFILIKNKQLAETFEEIFKILWEKSKNT